MMGMHELPQFLSFPCFNHKLFKTNFSLKTIVIFQKSVFIYTAASAEWLVITQYLLKCDQSFLT